jgi:hypothetical protein
MDVDRGEFDALAATVRRLQATVTDLQKQYVAVYQLGLEDGADAALPPSHGAATGPRRPRHLKAVP